MKNSCVVIGGGLSGLAAAIRLARFLPQVTLVEQHSRIGGLNSYYYRHKRLFETGLHAITNYADPSDKKAPINRLFRQLKLKRSSFEFCEQIRSEVIFTDNESLQFSNDFSLLKDQVREKFPERAEGFERLVQFLESYNPFEVRPFTSAKAFLNEMIGDRLLCDMLLCPLMYYGSSVENDMDLSQFAIMFNAIYQEGMFRPSASIEVFLTRLREHFEALGGTVRLGVKVEKIKTASNRAEALVLSSGETLEPDFILSTAGHIETRNLIEQDASTIEDGNRLGFVESIFQIPNGQRDALPDDRTVIFYNRGSHFDYRQPDSLCDYNSGVICFPFNFQDLISTGHIEIRSTHLASYRRWKELEDNRDNYLCQKKLSREKSLEVIEKIIGNQAPNIVYQDTFTPLTIKRYTGKKDGAIYGSSAKIKDGDIGYGNLFIAGTDQGFLGIVGAMLSGVSIVNQQILSRC